MNVAELAGNGLALVVVAIGTGILVTIVGLAVVGWLIQRWRLRSEARLDAMSNRVLQLAAALSDQTRADGYEARVRLIRAAHAAMSEQQLRAGRPS